MSELDLNRVEGTNFVFEPSAESLADAIIQQSGITFPAELNDQLRGVLAEAAHEGMTFMYSLVEAGLIEVPDKTIERRIRDAELEAYSIGFYDGQIGLID